MEIWVVNKFYQWDGDIDCPPEAAFSTEDLAKAYVKKCGYSLMGRYAPRVTKLVIDGKVNAKHRSNK